MPAPTTKFGELARTSPAVGAALTVTAAGESGG